MEIPTGKLLHYVYGGDEDRFGGAIDVGEVLMDPNWPDCTKSDFALRPAISIIDIFYRDLNAIYLLT